MVATGQMPAATLLIKFGDQPAFKKIENVFVVERIRASFAFQKTKLLAEMKIVEDSNRVEYSKKVLDAYSGMKIFKNPVVADALNDPEIVSKTATGGVIDIPALKKKCLDGGVPPQDMETLLNILKNAH